MTSEEQADYRARRGTAEDIVNLVEMYGRLDAPAKGELLTRAAELMAEQRVSGRKMPDGKAYDAYDWLKTIAEDTYPSGEDGARLLQQAADRNCYGLDAVFGDGKLSVALSPSEDERANGEGLYEGYMMVWNDVSPGQYMPSPAEFLGIKTLNRDYSEYEYAEGEEEWKAGIYNQCIDVAGGLNP